MINGSKIFCVFQCIKIQSGTNEYLRVQISRRWWNESGFFGADSSRSGINGAREYEAEYVDDCKQVIIL